MTTNYDPIAEQYKRSKLAPWRSHIECHTLFEIVGDVKGLAVVDIACGEGFYTRLLRHRGAARATGVDLSQGMIDLARKQEAAEPLGIDYRVGDGRALDLAPEYDLAVAGYLLNYARNREELGDMCASVARCLKPGGRFVTVNSNPALDFSRAPSYRRYGFETSVAGPWREGAPITWTFHLEDGGTFSIENYYLSVAAHEDALRQAGFRTIRWHRPGVAPDGAAGHAPDFWKAFLDSPPVTFIECVK